ncbi:hypothetical protein MCOR25_001534 [Pyricularia grisea]|nr:hypothetical protein MCOR25_001534 [Pyricularia grisea]
MIPNSFTDEEIGIEFASWSVFTAASRIEKFPMVMTLPADALEREATEYVGYLLSPQPKKYQKLCYRRARAAKQQPQKKSSAPKPAKKKQVVAVSPHAGPHDDGPVGDGVATQGPGADVVPLHDGLPHAVAGL